MIGSNRGAKIKEFLGVEYKELVDSGVLVEEVPEIVETPEPTELEEVKAEIAEIKILLKKVLDDKSHRLQAELEQKELVQFAVKALNIHLCNAKRHT